MTETVEIPMRLVKEMTSASASMLMQQIKRTMEARSNSAIWEFDVLRQCWRLTVMSSDCA